MPNPTRPYEPLTSDNAALVLIDHQVGLMTGVRNYSIAELKQATAWPIDAQETASGKTRDNAAGAMPKTKKIAYLP